MTFARYEGKHDPRWLDRMVDNAAGHKIRVDFKPLSSTRAGFATIALGNRDWKMRIAIHEPLDPPSKLGVLCHELAHILLGHLGSDHDRWWPSRANLSHQTVEIEAEATAYVTMSRLGLQGSSDAYVCRHLGTNDELPSSVSVDLIAKVSGHLEKMAREKLPPKTPRKKRSASGTLFGGSR